MNNNPIKQKLPLQKQRGTAIIVALFVVALVAAAATIMMTRLRTDIHRTELILNANNAYLLAQGSIGWARDQLNTNFLHQQPNKVIDRTPIQSAATHENNATIKTVIQDAQGLFNLNNLTDQQYQQTFLRLIQVLAPEINAETARNITFATIDWISPGSKNPLLDEYYLKLAKPYRSSHRLMASASELRLIKGVTAELYAKLSPFIIALPQTTTININNAEIPVLMSLSPTLSLDAAKAVRTTAQSAPFATPEAFLNFAVIKNNPIEPGKITVKSDFFLVITSVTLGQQTLTLNTLLQRTAQGSKTKTIPIWQSKGPL